MIRRPQPASISRPADQRQLLELLQQRQRALRREWQICALPLAVDDDLLPARQRLEDALVEVDQAIVRIKTGRFGRCVACARQIDFQRLLAHPSATHCWPCQQSLEQVEPDPLTH
jgi:hypothetical protein